MPITANTAIIGNAGMEEPVFGEVVDVDAPDFAEPLLLPLLPDPFTLTFTVWVLLLSFLLLLSLWLLLSFLLLLSLVFLLLLSF
jgi:hypothetical protein